MGGKAERRRGGVRILSSIRRTGEAGGGEDKPPEPQKLKIDIPDTPFEPDINQVKDRLKHILKQWQVGEYPSDEYRWKSYFKDLQKLVKVLDGDK